MCGFIGEISRNNIDYNKLLKCNRLITCRGPDELRFLNDKFSNYSEKDEKFKFNFIFNRLAIIDLSPLASQPMVSKKFKSILMFNGEIYNHKVLRKELESKGIEFKSNHSDSEVVLLGLSHFGIKFLNRLVGQFSIAFYDGIKREFYLARDRLGQKPLFYNYSDDSFKFSSNLKSLTKFDENLQVNEHSLYKYICLGVVPSPKTIFKNYYKVEPGSVIKFSINEKIILEDDYKYWNINDFVSDENFSEEKFFEIFENAVSLREEADVNVAHFLSGGIDSTAILKNSHDRSKLINSYSVKFVDSKYDESIYSNEVAKVFKTNHTEKLFSVKNLSDIVTESINVFDEPYADPSSVPSYVICNSISENYKVAISGDGGDELLGGYQRVNESLRPKSFLKSFLGRGFYEVLPSFLGTGNNFLKNSNNLSEAYSSYLTDNKFAKLLSIKSEDINLENYFGHNEDNYKKLMIAEYKFFLSEMMMLKVDRTSMANSLEVRSPFVDHRLVQYVLSTNNSYVDYKNPKQILKKYLLNNFNTSFTNRKKMGFVFDIEKWIYSNSYEVKEKLISKNSFLELNLKDIEKLFLYKSRMNANRLWKLYFIKSYFDNL